MPGTLLLDSEGLSRLYLEDRTVVALVQAAPETDVRVATTAMALVEADHERVHLARVSWVLSRIDVLGVTRAVADQAVALLRTHHLHGRKYAIDAVLASIARNAIGPVTILTSDPEDLALLCGPAIEVVKV
jgi:hypothetical protein